MRKAYYLLTLTPHQREALLTVIGGYIRGDIPAEVSIDAATGEEIRIEDLLALVLNVEPTISEEGSTT